MITNPEPHNTRAGTDTEGNAPMDARTEENIRTYADATQGELSQRIRQLEGEWGFERTLEINASALSMVGLALAATVSRKWLALPVAATSLLVWHGAKGWSPPMPLLRRLGLRTRAEINREMYALKALRGDFQRIERKPQRPDAHVTKVLDAVAPEPETPEAAAPSEGSYTPEGGMTPTAG